MEYRSTASLCYLELDDSLSVNAWYDNDTMGFEQVNGRQCIGIGL